MLRSVFTLLLSLFAAAAIAGCASSGKKSSGPSSASGSSTSNTAPAANNDPEPEPEPAPADTGWHLKDTDFGQKLLASIKAEWKQIREFIALVKQIKQDQGIELGQQAKDGVQAAQAAWDQAKALMGDDEIREGIKKAYEAKRALQPAVRDVLENGKGYGEPKKMIGEQLDIVQARIDALQSRDIGDKAPSEAKQLHTDAKNDHKIAKQLAGREQWYSAYTKLDDALEKLMRAINQTIKAVADEKR